MEIFCALSQTQTKKSSFWVDIINFGFYLANQFYRKMKAWKTEGVRNITGQWQGLLVGHKWLQRVQDRAEDLVDVNLSTESLESGERFGSLESLRGWERGMTSKVFLGCNVPITLNGAV